MERLKEIKRKHEAQEASRSSPSRLVPDPAKASPQILKLCISGEDLWQSANGGCSFSPSYPAGFNEEQAGGAPLSRRRLPTIMVCWADSSCTLPISMIDGQYLTHSAPY